MSKYKIQIVRTITGTVEVCANNEDDAIYRLRKQPPLLGQIEIINEEDELVKPDCECDLSECEECEKRNHKEWLTTIDTGGYE